MVRRFEVDDEGDYFEVHLIEDEQKIAGALVDVIDGRIDDAFNLALLLGSAFVVNPKPVGHGAASAPYRPA